MITRQWVVDEDNEHVNIMVYEETENTSSLVGSIQLSIADFDTKEKIDAEALKYATQVKEELALKATQDAQKAVWESEVTATANALKLVQPANKEALPE